MEILVHFMQGGSLGFGIRGRFWNQCAADTRGGVQYLIPKPDTVRDSGGTMATTPTACFLAGDAGQAGIQAELGSIIGRYSVFIPFQEDPEGFQGEVRPGGILKNERHSPGRVFMKGGRRTGCHLDLAT